MFFIAGCCSSVKPNCEHFFTVWGEGLVALYAQQGDSPEAWELSGLCFAVSKGPIPAAEISLFMM